MFGYYRMPFIQTPSVMESTQFDSYQMLMTIGHTTPKSSAEIDYATSFAQTVVDDMNNLYQTKSDLVIPYRI